MWPEQYFAILLGYNLFVRKKIDYFVFFLKKYLAME